MSGLVLVARYRSIPTTERYSQLSFIGSPSGSLPYPSWVAGVQLGLQSSSPVVLINLRNKSFLGHGNRFILMTDKVYSKVVSQISFFLER